MGLRVRPPPSLRNEALRTRQTRPRLTGPPPKYCGGTRWFSGKFILYQLK